MPSIKRQPNTTSTAPVNDFNVDPSTGIGYMSRRELSRRLGVSHTAINKQVSTLQPNASVALDDFLVSKVSTYFLTKGVVRNIDFVENLIRAGARAFIYTQAGYDPLQQEYPLHLQAIQLFKVSIPERWVVEIIGRRQSSVRRSLSIAIERSVGSALEKHVEYRDGGRWYSAWFLANAPFTKADGMCFKHALTGLVESLKVEAELKQFLLN